ncbi:MAG: formylglycine-generating enzyme family protein [Deltaproteobacteria bacterium]|jgi:formylglycine-generating enzyme required for sulfatase activity|nr:formylglycine-generating enzyme family protein [Deltaproteobacteria bacterium]
MLIDRKNLASGYLAKVAVLALVLGAIFPCLALVPAQAQAQAQPITPENSQVAKELGLAFARIEPGTFVMGANTQLERFTNNASPRHEVTITKPFYMGKFEVTQRQWQAVMDLNPSRFKGETLPVDSVTWDKAKEFIDKLNEREGRVVFRLPTEAEWEYAARAGTSSVYSFSNSPIHLGDYAWFTNNSDLTTHPVGQKKPNPWGLYDTLGNVREWTSDWMEPYPKEAVVDPKGPAEGSNRIARGGAFSFIDVNCAISRRVGYRPDIKQNFLGLRLVLAQEEVKPEAKSEAAAGGQDQARAGGKADEKVEGQPDSQTNASSEAGGGGLAQAPAPAQAQAPAPDHGQALASDQGQERGSSQESSPSSENLEPGQTPLTSPQPAGTGSNPGESPAVAAPGEGAADSSPTPSQSAEPAAD